MMSNLFSKFMSDERGDIVQYIIVLAVVAIILAFAFPLIRDYMGEATEGTLGNMDEALGGVDSEGDLIDSEDGNTNY